ncbi:MAG: DNA recombination protein RmuC [Pseudomonadota bacterium]|nr:DNA recombination protein RmuC [Pseudomonadota bacterium]MEC8525076.1 DNA recombination protein RmuC [Pseudomonadota bacterium]
MIDSVLSGMPSYALILFFGVVVLLSVSLGWLARDRRASQQVVNNAVEQDRLLEQLNRLKDEKESLLVDFEDEKSQLHQSRAQEKDAALALAREQEKLGALQRQEQVLAQRLTDTENKVLQLQQNLNEVQARLATEREARQQEQRNADEKLAVIQESREQLLKEFEHLSQKIFEQKTKQFSEQSQQGINTLLNPFREQLDGLKKKVEDVYVADAKDRASLQAQIGELHKLNQQMSAEAHALTTALRGEKKTQGNWGEMVLQTVLEKSGLREGEEFIREQSLNNDDGKRFRPDVIINLPDDKHIVVDSKVSLNAYTDMVNADSDAERQQCARRHVEAIRQHIRSLSEKAYQQLDGLNSPDFVFLFMPVEPAFMVAFEHDDNLFNEAFERRIVVVTPTTLLATLRTVASIWAIERRNKSTEKLADQAGKIYDKLAIVVERMETMGRQINTVQGTYDDTWKALKGGRGNLINQADQFRKLGVRAKKEMAKALVEEANAEHDLYEAQAQTRASKPTSEQQAEFELLSESVSEPVSEPKASSETPS